MTNVLKDGTDNVVSRLLSQQKVLYASHCTAFALICKVIPCVSIAIEHSWRLENLPSVLATLTLESVMAVARGVVSELEQFAKTVERKVSLYVLGAVDHTGR